MLCTFYCIDADPGLFDNLDQLPGFFMARYQGQPEFEDKIFKVS